MSQYFHAWIRQRPDYWGNCASECTHYRNHTIFKCLQKYPIIFQYSLTLLKYIFHLKNYAQTGQIFE